MRDNFAAGIARHLAATTPLPADKAAVIVQHCGYQLEHRGHLYDWEQALLVRVARFASTGPRGFKSRWAARKRRFS